MTQYPWDLLFLNVIHMEPSQCLILSGCIPLASTTWERPEWTLSQGLKNPAIMLGA
jgi:hypothetical protein